MLCCLIIGDSLIIQLKIEMNNTSSNYTYSKPFDDFSISKKKYLNFLNFDQLTKLQLKKCFYNADFYPKLTPQIGFSSQKDFD